MREINDRDAVRLAKIRESQGNAARRAASIREGDSLRVNLGSGTFVRSVNIRGEWTNRTLELGPGVRDVIVTGESTVGGVRYLGLDVGGEVVHLHDEWVARNVTK